MLRKKNKVDENVINNIKTLQKMKDQVWEIRTCYSSLGKNKLANTVKNICKTSDQIVKEVSINQEKITKVTVWTDFYLPSLLKMLQQYTNITKNKLTGENCDDIRVAVEDMVPQIDIAFKKLLDSLYGADNIDIDTDIQVMLRKFNLEEIK